MSTKLYLEPFFVKKLKELWSWRKKVWRCRKKTLSYLLRPSFGPSYMKLGLACLVYAPGTGLFLAAPPYFLLSPPYFCTHIDNKGFFSSYTPLMVDVLGATI